MKFSIGFVILFGFLPSTLLLKPNSITTFLVKSKHVRYGTTVYGLAVGSSGTPDLSMEFTCFGKLHMCKMTTKPVDEEYMEFFQKCYFHYVIVPESFSLEEFEAVKFRNLWMVGKALEISSLQIGLMSLVTLTYAVHAEVVVKLETGTTQTFGIGKVQAIHGNFWVFNIYQIVANGKIVSGGSYDLVPSQTTISFRLASLKDFKLDSEQESEQHWNGNHFVDLIQKDNILTVECVVGVRVAIKFSVDGNPYYGLGTVEINQPNKWILKISRFPNSLSPKSINHSTFGTFFEFSPIKKKEFDLDELPKAIASVKYWLTGKAFPFPVLPSWKYGAFEVEFMTGREGCLMQMNETEGMFKIPATFNELDQKLIIIGQDNCEKFRKLASKKCEFYPAESIISTNIEISSNPEKSLTLKNVTSAGHDEVTCEIYSFYEMDVKKVWVATRKLIENRMIGHGNIYRIGLTYSWVVRLTHARRDGFTNPVSLGHFTEFTTMVKDVEVRPAELGGKDEFNKLTSETYKEKGNWIRMNVAYVQWISLSDSVNRIELTCVIGNEYSLISNSTTHKFKAFRTNKFELAVDFGTEKLLKKTNQENFTTKFLRWEKLIHENPNYGNNIRLDFDKMSVSDFGSDSVLARIPYSLDIEKGPICYIQFEKDGEVLFGEGILNFFLPEESGIIWITKFGTQLLSCNIFKPQAEISEIQTTGWNWKLSKNKLNEDGTSDHCICVNVPLLPNFNDVTRQSTAFFNFGNLEILIANSVELRCYRNTKQNVLTRICSGENGIALLAIDEYQLFEPFSSEEVGFTVPISESINNNNIRIPTIKIKILEQINNGIENDFDFRIQQYSYQKIQKFSGK